MGSGASVDERFPEDIRKTYALTEEVKEQIATHDARFLKVQSSQAWKDHKKIITALTERTKSQLQRVARIFAKIEAEEGRNISAEMEIRNMLGGSYGDFMRLLVVSVDAINTELLDTALKCIGCDENLIADVLCAIPSHELTSTQVYYNSCHQEPLQSVIKSKTLENSSFQKFVLKILSTPRSTEKSLSEEVAALKAEELHDAGAGGHSSTTDGRKQKDDDRIFSLLSSLSRDQCHLISEQFEAKYGMTLEAGITSIYGGSCARALILWVSPLLSAISSLFYMSLSSAVIDYDQTCHLATKYEKHVLQQVMESYEQIYSEKLIDKLSKSLTGNFKKSVIAWFTNPTYDDGFESKISSLVESCDGSLEKLLNDPNKLDELSKLVHEENNSASSHLDETVAALTKDKKPTPKSDSTKSSGLPAPLLTGKSRKNIAKEQSADPTPTETSPVESAPLVSNKEESNVPAVDIAEEPLSAELTSPSKPVELPPAAEIIINKPSKRKQMGYEEKYKLICDYLLTRFQQDDIDDSGMLNSNEFWNTLKSLNVGYTEDELAGIQAWVDYDGDGEISYAEVINELADSLIDIIEAQGQTVEDKVNELWEQNRIELARLWDEYQNWAEQQDVGTVQDMSPSLTQYLKDSFEAFDVDSNGTLDSNEFWNILVTVLGLSEGDRAMMEVYFPSYSHFTFS